MNADLKSQLPELGKIGGALAAGILAVTGITYLALSPSQPRTVTWEWDANGNDSSVYYELWSTVNLASNKSWYFKARVTGTNRVTFARTNEQEFFAVRAAQPYVTGPDSQAVTNWMYSDWSVKK
jgi:hypothetical protein